MNVNCPNLINEETGLIKTKYTCDGENISPSIKWSGIPDGTKSFVVYLHDPDASSKDWVHWAIINIPVNVNELPEVGPIKGDELINDFKKKGYGGPCPPSGTHKYVFEVFALSVERLEGVTIDNLLKKVNEVKLDSAQLIAKYERALNNPY